MTARSHHRGHQMYFDEEADVWRYTDTDELVSHLRNCGECGEPRTPEGHDPCLGTLPGVMNACCGHGRLVDVYVQLTDESCLRGQVASEFIARIRAGR